MSNAKDENQRGEMIRVKILKFDGFNDLKVEYEINKAIEALNLNVQDIKTQFTPQGEFVVLIHFYLMPKSN